MTEMIHLPWRHVSLVKDDSTHGPDIWTSLLIEEVNELAALAYQKSALEIGTACGFASVAMAMTAKFVTTVDLPGGWVPGQEHVDATFRAYGVEDKIERVLESSLTYLPAANEAGWAFDLIFIDGDHSAAVLREDFLNSAELIRPGGKIAVHDYLEDCCVDVKPVMDDIIPEGPDYIKGTMAVYKF